MNWNWKLAGQITVCAIVLGFAFAPYIARYVRARKARKHLRAVIHQHARPRDPMKYEGRDLPIDRTLPAGTLHWTENEYQMNARRAESLGFIEPDEKAS